MIENGFFWVFFGETTQNNDLKKNSPKLKQYRYNYKYIKQEENGFIGGVQQYKTNILTFELSCALIWLALLEHSDFNLKREIKIVNILSIFQPLEDYS